MEDIGPESNLVESIWHYIFSLVIRIFSNGKVTDNFFSSRGIRQGDPLSPYLFILCMERLAHLIQYAIDNKYWKSFRT